MADAPSQIAALLVALCPFGNTDMHVIDRKSLEHLSRGLTELRQLDGFYPRTDGIIVKFIYKSRDDCKAAK